MVRIWAKSNTSPPPILLPSPHPLRSSKSTMLPLSFAMDLLSRLSILQYSPSVMRLKDRFGDDYLKACIKEVTTGEEERVDVKKCLRLLYEEAFRM